MTNRRDKSEGKKNAPRRDAAAGASRDWRASAVDAARAEALARDGISPLTEADVDALFEAAAADAADAGDLSDVAPLAPSDDLMARIMGDADAALAAQTAAAPAWATAEAAPTRRGIAGLLAGLSESIGGWRGATGLAAASVVGLGLGLFSPASLASIAAGDWVAGDEFTYEASISLDDMLPVFYDIGTVGTEG